VEWLAMSEPLARVSELKAIRMVRPRRLYLLPVGREGARRMTCPFHSPHPFTLRYMLSLDMSWLAWLALAVLVSAVAAVTGIKPRGTRHVAHTRLMGMARLALLVMVIVFAYLAFRARSGG
jgi:hypothetical protein